MAPLPIVFTIEGPTWNLERSTRPIGVVVRIPYNKSSFFGESDMEKTWVRYYDEQVPVSVDYPSQTVYDLFQAAVRKNPSGVATIFVGAKIRYRQLDDLVNRFASGFGCPGCEEGQSRRAGVTQPAGIPNRAFCGSQVGRNPCPYQSALCGERTGASTCQCRSRNRGGAGPALSSTSPS